MGGWLKKCIIRYCKIYFLWSLIYSPLAIVYYVKEKFTLQNAIISYLRDLFYTGQHYNSWILWYVLSSIYAMIVIYIILKFFRKRTNLMLVLLSAFSVFVYIGLHIISGRNDVISSVRLLHGCIYMPIGILIYEYRQKLLSIRIIIWPLTALFLSLTSIVFQYVCDVRVIQDIIIVGLATALFVSIICLKSCGEKNTSSYRKISTYIFYLHLYIWTAYYSLVYGEKHFGMDSFIVTCISTIVVSYIVYTIRNKRIIPVEG